MFGDVHPKQQWKPCNARCGFHMLFRMLSAQISNGNIKAKFKWHILYHFFIYFVSYLFDIFKSVAINIYFLNSAIQAGQSWEFRVI